jgi:hypothetical protein
MMMLLATAVGTVAKWLRRAILALAQPAAHSNRNSRLNFTDFRSSEPNFAPTETTKEDWT